MKLITTILLSFFISEAAADEKWISFISEAHEYLSKKQDILMKVYKLGEHERFDWDQESGSLVFSNNGISAVIAKVQFVGSISTKSNTWLWSWANSTVLDNVKDEMNKIKEFGNVQKFDALTTDKWKADEIDGWEMTSITAKVLEAKGAYRTTSSNGFTYMVITNIKWAN